MTDKLPESNPRGVPTVPPAVGGWYWDEKAQHARFLMPPYPGVDDCVKIDGKWAYRSLVERDRRTVAEAAEKDQP